MKNVQVVIQVYQGIIEDVSAFSTDKKARASIKRAYGKQGEDYLAVVDNEMSRQHYDEIHGESDSVIQWHSVNLDEDCDPMPADDNEPD